jgi:hypothetical protein
MNKEEIEVQGGSYHCILSVRAEVFGFGSGEKRSQELDGVVSLGGRQTVSMMVIRV